MGLRDPARAHGRPSRVWPEASLYAAGVVLAGCTLFSDFDVRACDTDESCVFARAGSYCSAGRCVEGCRNNRQCAEVDPRRPLCSRSAGECVALASPGDACYVSTGYDDHSMGERTTDELLVLGAFAPSVRSATWLTLQLAADELEAGRRVSGPELDPVLVVACDDALARDSPEIGSDAQAMDDLVGRLGARGVVGSFDSDATSSAVAAAGEEALVLDPDGTFDDVSAQSYWHLGGDYRELLPTMHGLIEELGPRWRARARVAGRPPRVAIVAGSARDARMASATFDSLVFDGSSGPQLIVADRLHRNDETPQVASDWDGVVADLATFDPDLVLAFLSGTFRAAPRQERAMLLGRLEEAAAVQPGGGSLYVIGPRRGGDVYLDTLAASSASFRSRALVVDLALPGQEELAALQMRFAERYVLASAELARAAPRIYDALYYLAYAGWAWRDAVSHPTQGLLGGLLRVTRAGSASVPVGGGGLETGLALLGAGSSLDLHGSTGSGDLDAQRQLRANAPAVHCWRADGSLVERGSPSAVHGDGCAPEVLDGPIE